MRILQFNTYADPIGGAEVYAQTLTDQLRSRGHVVAFFGTSPNREVDEECLRVVRRPLYDARRLWREPAVRAAFETFARRFRPDMVHVHNVFSLGLDVLEAVARLELPTVQTVHDFNRLCPNSWCVRGDGTICDGGIGAQCFAHDCQKNYPFDAQVALHALLRHRALLSMADVSICPSRNLAERLRRQGCPSAVHLPNAIEPIATPGSIPRQTKRLLYVGRLTPEKGVDCLLEALPAIRRQDLDVRLTLIAGGSPPAEQTARIRGMAGVELLTDLPRAELGRYYASASACVLPSIWSENAPLVAFECLAAGLPMIASRIGGLPELVEDGVTGFTFRPRDAADLATTILRFLALTPSDRERMSTSMRARSSGFGLSAHVTRVEQLYGEVLQRRRRPAAPSTPLDADLLAILDQTFREKERVEQSRQEKLVHLRPFALSQDPSAGRRRRLFVSQVRRIARTLRLPKVFSN